MSQGRIDQLFRKIVKDCENFPGDVNTPALTPEDFIYMRVTKDELMSIINSNPSHLYIYYHFGRDGAHRLFEYLVSKLSYKTEDKVIQRLDGEYLVAYVSRWEILL